MARKKELSEQEKVAEILKRSSVSFDLSKAEAQIALNTRCKRCGRTLSSLERITFENKCSACMEVEAKENRDKFVRKYIIIAFTFIVALVLGGYCANTGSKAWRIVGVVVCSILTCASLGYVFYTNIDRILPSLQQKFQVWVVGVLSVGIAFVIGLLTYMFESWILYIILMLAVVAYVSYIAYKELVRLREKSNLLEVYKRKARDTEYVESITEAIESRAKQEEEEAKNAPDAPEKPAVDLLNNLDVPAVLSHKVAQILKERDTASVKKADDTDISADKSAETAQPADDGVDAPAAEQPEDSGDFFI